MAYLNRVFDLRLKAHLKAMGAVLIEGPKWCGKTTTAKQLANSVISLQDTDHREEYLATAITKPSFLLEGEVPRLIDEWQDAPMLWDAVRTKVDERGLPGQFILTGSNAIDDSKIHHSGTGRISRMEMLPMSLWEYGESNGSVSLMEMFDNPQEEIFATSELKMEEIIFAACRGGWPATLNLGDDKSKLLVAKEYVKSVYKNDISRIDGVKRNQKLAHLIMKSYARNISTLAKTTSILADVTASDDVECTRPTLESYIEALEKLFVIQDIEAWCPSIRSKTTIQSRPKRAFCDPSVAVALLNLSPESLMTSGIVRVMGIQCPGVGCGGSHTPQVIILVMLNQEFSPVVQLVCHRVQSSIFVISITLDNGFYCISAVLFNLHAYGMNSLLLAYFSCIWISLIVYIVSAQ